MDRVRKLKLVLWTLAGVAFAVAIARFLFGLGAATHLSDSNPWGVWIGFDVMSGVALAAGGFIVTTIVYIFKLERFHSIVRPAVLTAFLGYVAVAVSLLFDLGLPWNIWHMLVYWNPHSPLFEVGWCVMLYLTVLTLEFFPVPAEDFSALAKVRRFLVRIRLPLVLTGIGLSTLHQSSLGSLFLIMPYRVHPLWYSPILPVLFFISAVALGLMMVMCESHTSAYLYRRKPETEILAQMGGAVRWVLLLYVVVRFGDLILRGQASHLAGPEWQVKMFWIEIAILAIVPGVLFSIPRLRNSRAGQWSGAALGVTGVVVNRIDVGGFTHIRPSGHFYFPEWTELAISAGIVSVMALLFLYAIERFKIWEERPADPDSDPLKRPELDRVGATWLGIPTLAARTTYSMAFILAAAVGFALVGQPAASHGIDPTPVEQARGGEILWIDGNRDGYGVAFKHEEHKHRLGDKQSCIQCHHMNLPRDQNSACARCHTDMYRPVDSFRHDWHASPEGGRLECTKCHPAGQTRMAATAVHCDRCHQNLVPAGSTILVKEYQAVSYTEAMHRLCIGCHVKKAAEKNKPEMARCAWCHKDTRLVVDARDVSFHGPGLVGRSIVLPPIGK